MTVLEQQVLVLNRQWQAINVITVQAALSMMAADAATGMNFEEDGSKWGRVYTKTKETSILPNEAVVSRLLNPNCRLAHRYPSSRTPRLGLGS
jgi:hypothetical protein